MKLRLVYSYPNCCFVAPNKRCKSDGLFEPEQVNVKNKVQIWINVYLVELGGWDSYERAFFQIPKTPIYTM